MLYLREAYEANTPEGTELRRNLNGLLRYARGRVQARRQNGEATPVSATSTQTIALHRFLGRAITLPYTTLLWRG